MGSVFADTPNEQLSALEQGAELETQAKHVPVSFS
jgi:hypothetical protein